MADLNLIIANQGFVDEQEEDDVIIGAQGDGEEEAEGPGDGDGLIQPVGDQFLEGFPAFLQMFSSLPESQKKKQCARSWRPGSIAFLIHHPRRTTWISPTPWRAWRAKMTACPMVPASTSHMAGA